MASFKVDENLPSEVAALLATAGHDARTVVDQQLGGSTDLELIQVCRDEDRALITLDLDFADIRSYRPADYAGIVVLRLPRTDKLAVVAAVRRMIPLLEQEPLSGRLWILDESKLRIRA